MQCFRKTFYSCRHPALPAKPMKEGPMRRRAMHALFRHVMANLRLGTETELEDCFPKIPSFKSVKFACFGKVDFGDPSRFAEYAEHLESALASLSAEPNGSRLLDSLLASNMRMLIGLARQAVAYLRNEQIPDFQQAYDLSVLTIFADAGLAGVCCPRDFPVEMDLIKAGLLVLDVYEKSRDKKVALLVRGTNAYAATDTAEVVIGSSASLD